MIGSQVSVPLRGLWFLSINEKVNEDFGRFCFRPLAGIMVLIDGVLICTLTTTYRLFPSPCGDYGSYPAVTIQGMFIRQMKFPSPCGDYGSYQGREKMTPREFRERFRPLAGIMVLILNNCAT